MTEEEAIWPNDPQVVPPDAAEESEAPLEPPTNPEVRPSSPPPSAEVPLSPHLSPPPVPSPPHPSPPSSLWLSCCQSPEEPIGAPSTPEWLPEEPVGGSLVLPPQRPTKALPASGPEVIFNDDKPEGVPPRA